MRNSLTILGAALLFSTCVLPPLDADREPAPSGAGASGGSTSGTGGGGSGQGATSGTTNGGTNTGGGGGTNTGGSGGSNTSSAGAGGDDGTAGTAAAGGNPSAGSGGSPEVPITVDEFAGTVNGNGFAWKDSFIMLPCYDVIGADCITYDGACPGGGYVFNETFTMGGTPGKNYDVTIKVTGISSAKYYQNGVRQRGTDFSNAEDPAGTDTWHVGGTPSPSNYEVYSLTVYQADGTTEVEHYYFNSFPSNSNYEAHMTFPISYEATFEVPGDGVIAYKVSDPNCHVINNCGPGANDSGCPAPRDLPNDTVAIPAMYGGITTASMNTISGAASPWHAQIIHVVVTNVVEK